MNLSDLKTQISTKVGASGKTKKFDDYQGYSFKYVKGLNTHSLRCAKEGNPTSQNFDFELKVSLDTPAEDLYTALTESIEEAIGV